MVVLFFFFFHCCDKLPSKCYSKESGLVLLEKSGQQEHEGSGHVASTGRKQRKIDADAWLTSSFVFSPRRQAREGMVLPTFSVGFPYLS